MNPHRGKNLYLNRRSVKHNDIVVIVGHWERQTALLVYPYIFQVVPRFTIISLIRRRNACDSCTYPRRCLYSCVAPDQQLEFVHQKCKPNLS